MLLPPARRIGVGSGSTDTTDRIGNTRCGAESPSESNLDVVTVEEDDVMESLRLNVGFWGFWGFPVLWPPGPVALVLGEGESG